MRFTDDARTTLRINEHMSLRGIPAEAHEYQVNGRTPLEWLIDRYRIARDRESGIVNDPNAWFPDPRALPAALRRIVHLSVETTRLVAALPKAVDIDPQVASDTFDFRTEAHCPSLVTVASARERRDQPHPQAVTDQDTE